MVLSSVVSHRSDKLPAPAYLTSITRPSAYYLVQCPHCSYIIPWRPRYDSNTSRVRIHCSNSMCLRWFQNKRTLAKNGYKRKNGRPPPLWIGRIGAGITWRVVCTLGDRLNAWNSTKTYIHQLNGGIGPRPITSNNGEWWPTILDVEGFSSILLSNYPIPDNVMNEYGIQP